MLNSSTRFLQKAALPFVLGIMIALPANAESAAKVFVLKPDEELDLTFAATLEARTLVRICKDYLAVELPEQHMIIVAEAPTWSVRAISPIRKLTGVSSLQEWMRRGSPMNFLKVTALPEWPLIRLGSKPFQQWQATAYALPYKTQQGAIVPLTRGRVGDMVVLGEGYLPQQACEIMHTLIQTPKVKGLPVQINLWDADNSTNKINPLFIFSGGKASGPKELVTKSFAIVKRHGLPSSAGYKVCKNTHEVWVSPADTEGFEGLMR
jgi:hypothetical protein